MRTMFDQRPPAVFEVDDELVAPPDEEVLPGAADFAGDGGCERMKTAGRMFPRLWYHSVALG